MVPILVKNKELVVNNSVILVCIFLAEFFRSDNSFQDFTILAFFLLVLPYLYVKIVLKKKLSEFGFKLGNYRQGSVLGLVLMAIVVLFFYSLFHYTSFLGQYYLPKGIVNDFKLFLGYEFLLVGFMVVLFEFFFRGFVLFTFLPKFGRLAPIIQSLWFVFYFWVLGGLDWSMAHFVLLSLPAGFIAYRSQSVLFSGLFSFFSVLFTDVAAILILK